MEIRMYNLAFGIKDSSVLVNGLTIIAGEDDGAKSMIGKSLYAILQDNAVEHCKPLFYETFFAPTCFVSLDDDSGNAIVVTGNTENKTPGGLERKYKTLTIDDPDFINITLFSHGHYASVVGRRSCENKVTEYKEIESRLDDIFPYDLSNYCPEGEGRFIHKQKKEIYRTPSVGAGFLMLFMIKEALNGGEINENTILILENPESHLHPKKQNVFAEILCMIVKYVKARIVLTTNSQTFLLALDANMRRYGIEEQTNFYLQEQKNDGENCFSLKNDNIDEIHKGFLEAFSESKVLREKYIKEGGVSE